MRVGKILLLGLQGLLQEADILFGEFETGLADLFESRLGFEGALTEDFRVPPSRR